MYTLCFVARLTQTKNSDKLKKILSWYLKTRDTKNEILLTFINFNDPNYYHENY